MIDGILFDLDGTLWDSSENVTDSWNVVFRRYKTGKEITPEEFRKCMGMLMPDIIDVFLPDAGVDIKKQLLDACCEYECQYLSKTGGVLYKGLEDVLKALSKRYKLFIVSNCQSGYIEAFFKAHGLEKYFTDYEDPGRTGLDKAGNIKLVVERNNLKSPVYVGDIEGDYNSATKAGVPFIHAAYGFGKVPMAKYAIDDITKLEETLDNM